LAELLELLELLEEKAHRLRQPVGRKVGTVRRQQDVLQPVAVARSLHAKYVGI
jgi:hypothetical protein